ncbi:interferon-induced GTP-binding protein Mx3-like [Paramormyrops kingsleyae]|uniref:Interferon-induced GTP-binding protein Mx3-like n=1 Tax=Paramormyrops kingsleyae TaxID=1676925 RepID=A0A3B3SII8_9TELE|nr:interferon-induced GTP-binding protein Mx3-like [Paramormyrops kingsleyae]
MELALLEESGSLSSALSDDLEPGELEETAASPKPCGVTNILNEHYEEKVRPCIDLIDSLRSLGVEQDLALPAIAVIGDQSSGKSSVLEALSGVALPRGSGIVTRCPLELKMKKIKAEDNWYGKIKYKSEEKEIKDPSEVERFIRKAQDEIAGVGVGISQELISLEISSPDVPDLTLIDLPGIARVAVKGQPENIGEQIKCLIKKFIAKQETINLVVVPCNVDIATTEALKMAQEVDPHGERTLGILTKPDLVDKGTEETIVQIILNEVIHLAKGYMVVKCRGQKDITDRVSLTEALDKEKFFFEGHSHFGVLYKEGYASIPHLAEKLTLELVQHIEKSLPRLEDQIQRKIADLEKELERYGRGSPTDAADRRMFLIDKVTEFTQATLNLATGEELKHGNKASLLSVLRVQFEKWKKVLDESGLKFNQKIESESSEYEKKYRGRELPGFVNYKTFEMIMKEQISQLEEPAVKKLKEISDIVRRAFIQLSQESLIGYPNLQKTAKTKIEVIKQSKDTAAESILRTQFKMEMVVYTQDSTYGHSLKKMKGEDGVGFGFKSQTFSERTTLQEMAMHIKSYYQVASQRLADQIPLVVRYEILQEAARQLQREMIELLQNKDNVDDLLKEDYDIGTKRKNLIFRLSRLKEAQRHLLFFSL